jgi:hypothetical protein
MKENVTRKIKIYKGRKLISGDRTHTKNIKFRVNFFLKKKLEVIPSGHKVQAHHQRFFRLAGYGVDFFGGVK